MTSLYEYIEETSQPSPILQTALEDAQEFGLNAPDSATGQVLTMLAAASQAQAAIAVTPAASVVGLYLLEGLPEQAIVSCIDPEPEHQQRAKQTFREAGYPATRLRFLPSRPLDVMSRLAPESYQLIYADVPALEIRSFIDAALPLLGRGGSVVIADSLLDGTVADSTRKDRDTVACREVEDYVRTLEECVLTRLPLGAGVTILTKK